MKTEDVIRQIAKDNGVSPEEVENEIRNAIALAMMSKDPQAQMLWKQIAPDGKAPSVDAFLKFCVNKLKEL